MTKRGGNSRPDVYRYNLRQCDVLMRLSSAFSRTRLERCPCIFEVIFESPTCAILEVYWENVSAGTHVIFCQDLRPKAYPVDQRLAEVSHF